MDKAKLIEKLRDVKRYYKEIKPYYDVPLSNSEINLILTSLTAPVPDGKECEECAAKQKQIEELSVALREASLILLTPKTSDAG